MPKCLFCLLSFVMVVGLIGSKFPTQVYAQTPGQWSPRQQIPNIHELANTPYLVVDQNQTVYAFHSQPIDDDTDEWAIFFNQWDPIQGWTKPNDIILPPTGYLASIQGALLDHRGMMQIIFYGGNERSADIYYAWAPAVSAWNASAWSQPQVIGKNAILQNAALTTNNQDALFVLYSGNRDGNGIYSVVSPDGGNTWSEPTSVFLTIESRPFLSDPDLQVDAEGQLHAVWLVNDKTGTGQALYYAKLSADHTTWSQPLLLAEVGEPDPRLEKNIINSRITWPSLANNGKELVVMYTACDPCEKRFRLSADGGESWTNPAEPFASRGDYGGQGFSVDSNQGLHVIFGDRQRGGNLWHSVWQNGRWEEPAALLPASEVEKYGAGTPLVFQPWEPRTVVSQGNLLFVAWATDPGAGDNGTWYSYRSLNAPMLAVQPLLPAATQGATLTTITQPNNPDPTLTPTPLPNRMEAAKENRLARLNSNPAGPLVFSLMPVALLLVVVIVISQLARRQRR